jgi:hypothetical protein
MKMTRLEWRYLQRIALDHPYFDTHKLPLTEKEAKAIVKANITMTGREFVDSVYAKLGMTRPKEEKKCFAWLRNIGELFTVPPIRKIAIALLVVILMAIFFAATPTGRAIAESVIKYIAMLFDDGSLAVNRSDNGAAMIPVDTIPNFGEDKTLEQENSDVYIYSFEEFTTAMGVRPTILPFPHTKLYYNYDESIDYLMLHAEYETPKGTIITSQIWNMLDLVSFTSTRLTAYDSDPSVYYSIEENGTMTVTKYYEDSIIEINSNDSFTVDELINFLMNE